MTTHRVFATRRVAARPQLVYDIIADYTDGHRLILPKVFDGLDVEQGGVGAGTVIRFGMRVLGKVRYTRAHVEEPSPGRLLTERDFDTGAVTSFLVEPATGGAQSDVTISTELELPGGALVRLQRWFATHFLRRVYAEELGLLDTVARRRSAASQG
jgi:Polyketide cyclase / dehydrase and lipid transport.